MRFFALFFMLQLWLGSASAEDYKAQAEAAFKAASAALRPGPAEIPVAGQSTLKLPANFGFIPAQETRAVMQAMGNHPSNEIQGMIVSTAGEKNNWFILVSYTSAGYIKDDDAKSWNADELLNNIREGTEETNKERKQRGIPEMEIVGWVEKPQYDASTQRLVWSIASHDKGQPSGPDNGINYNTYVLGREGFVSMNLVTDSQAVEGLKPVAKELLAAMTFNDGKRYADFQPGSDKVAEYGLAALIAGVAAKKLGLLALIGVFFAKFAKIIMLAVLGGGAVIAKLFKRKKDDAQA